MNAIVVYRSKTGFTQRYAQWIAQRLDCPVMDFKDVRPDKLEPYDLIVYGGRVYAGKIDAFHKFRQLLPQNKEVKLVVFAVGIQSAEKTEVMEKLWRDNLPESEWNTVPHFYLQGGLAYDRMGKMDRLIMKAVSISTAKKREGQGKAADSELDLQRSIDATSQAYIEPLIERVLEL